ncbi:hypothetical protein CC78DRAFT_530488 [Lojkania enalia]|uniref:Ring-like domain-containing protein n=1 Tax=Lojkania enalia TaxID=147567 RepID=A0A9P4N6Y4_9PLEO|nr:hypothetical protein CC78DRAFT_530488 [Didymosphaeria enalia]
MIDEAVKVSLPMSPPEINIEDSNKSEGKEKEKATGGGISRRKSVMSYFQLAHNKFKRSVDKDKESEREAKDKKKDRIADKRKAKAADDLHSPAGAAKSAEGELEKEQQDLTEILDQLNLSAVNNRVFSFSKESQELLEKFKLVLKDLVNGVPTAYNDLEKLLTDSENQLKNMYGNLPPFLQNLVKSLPAKISAALGPEILAAQAEKPGFDAKQRMGTSSKKSKRPKIPSLKSLISAEGAVATMLKSIFNFLKLRFPALMTGTNLLMSLAVFLLLFVFWYCHKRGRESRLERERLAAEDPDSALASGASSFKDDGDSLLPGKGEGSNEDKDEPRPPLIISDGKEANSTRTATIGDMPSVSHLPEPSSMPVPESNGPTPMKETLGKAP